MDGSNRLQVNINFHSQHGLKTFFFCSKKGTGKFTWERSDILVENVTDLWVNVSTHAEVGQKKGDSHDCVFLGPVNTTQEIKLDHTDCRDSVARPLCQYLVQ